MGFNKLNEAEIERLALLLEELGEAQQAIGKILRHGYESTHPDGGDTNRTMLEREMGDVSAAIAMMGNASDISTERIAGYAHEKLGRVKKYLHHQ